LVQNRVPSQNQARARKRGVAPATAGASSLPGLLLHIDGSRHQWFQDERWYDLIVILDDASSEIHYAQRTTRGMCSSLGVSSRGQPTPRQFPISGCSLHATGDTSLGYVEAEHEQFAVDAGSTPGGVLGHHPENQIPRFAGDPPATSPLSDLGEHAPVQAKAGTVPADHRFRSDQQE
jgi:hypothetical protein